MEPPGTRHINSSNYHIGATKYSLSTFLVSIEIPAIFLSTSFSAVDSTRESSGISWETKTDVTLPLQRVPGTRELHRQFLRQSFSSLGKLLFGQSEQN